MKWTKSLVVLVLFTVHSFVGMIYTFTFLHNWTNAHSSGHSNYCVYSEIFRRRLEFSPSDLTFVTQASLNLAPLLHQHAHLWNGPISAALFVETVEKVKDALFILSHLHQCDILVNRRVSIHVFHPLSANGHCLFRDDVIFQSKIDCNTEIDNYRLGHSFSFTQPYPINVARNIARQSSTTDFQMVADIELLPNVDFVEKVRPLLGIELAEGAKTVLVVPTFEIHENTGRPPGTKAELFRLILIRQAYPFHRFRAYQCHRIPELDDWWKVGDDHGPSKVFVRIPWKKPCWEPVYIGRASLPLYDERFKGYGKNKIQQIYELCRDDFRFAVLDNVFLWHKNVSVLTPEEWLRIKHIVDDNNRIYRVFQRELDAKYSPSVMSRYCDSRNLYGRL